MVTKGMLVKQETYLESGIHIGTKIRTSDMRPYIFKRRDGLFILDLRKTDEMLLKAVKLMAKYPPEEVLVVASRAYSSGPASRFSALTGIPVILGRFVPGMMTNLSIKTFREPRLIIVCDPKGEREAISESAKIGVPIIALCDSDNETKFIDLIIPANNKGKRALALIFFILTREIMLAQGKLASYTDFTHDINYFEQPIEDKAAKAPKAAEVQAKPEPAEEQKAA